MNEEKRKGAFIPCGDSLERMQEIQDDELENVSGGAGFSAAPKTCPKCGGVMLATVNPQRGVIGFACGMCDHMEYV